MLRKATTLALFLAVLVSSWPAWAQEIQFAAKTGDLARVKALVQGDPDLVNQQDMDGNTALHLASSRGRDLIVEFLLVHGADINVRNVLGQTPFNLTQQGNFERVTRLLIAKGADRSPPRFPVLKGKYLGQKPPGLKPEVFAPGIVTTMMGMHGNIVFSPDFTEACWHPDEPRGLYFMKSEGGRWKAPEEDKFLNDYMHDAPCYSYDGNRLFFLAGTPGPGGKTENEKIWFVNRASHGWSAPQLLDPVLDSLSLQRESSFDHQGNLYFGGKNATDKSSEIYCSPMEGGRYATPVKLPPTVNTEAPEFSPFVSPDGDYLIFGRLVGSPDSRPQFAIFVSFRQKNGDWTEAASLSEKLASQGFDSNPKVSPDGKYLFFMSRRGGIDGVFWVDAAIIGELK